MTLRLKCTVFMLCILVVYSLCVVCVDCAQSVVCVWIVHSLCVVCVDLAQSVCCVCVDCTQSVCCVCVDCAQSVLCVAGVSSGVFVAVSPLSSQLQVFQAVLLLQAACCPLQFRVSSRVVFAGCPPSFSVFSVSDHVFVAVSPLSSHKVALVSSRVVVVAVSGPVLQGQALARVLLQVLAVREVPGGPALRAEEREDLLLRLL